MLAATDPHDDATRYAALMNHRLTRRIIGDAKSVQLVEAASQKFAVPIASIGLVGRTNVHLVAEIGTQNHVIPRALSFSAHALDSVDPLVVEDTLLDRRYADHPTIVERRVRFFAAAPLITREGHRLGAFCIIDRRPRPMPDGDVALLVRFAAAAMARIDFLSVISDLSRNAVMPAPTGSRIGDEVIW